ncbi:MAG TPA: carbohydrate ABC transporter permease [Actinomycetota bacterium]|nr:carbohydrate ABC transporter permease [Actinomycetota bacterium]
MSRPLTWEGALHRSLRRLPSIAILAVFLAPLVFAVAASLRPTGTAPPVSLELAPDGASLSNYTDLLQRPTFRRQALNSVVVAAVTVPLGTLVASWAGFAIARLPRRASMFLLALTVIAAAIPVTSLFVGRLVLFRFAGAIDTPIPLIAPALIGVTPLLVLLFAWSYDSIPRETYDLAREVGLGPLATWWRVAVPLRIGVAGAAAAVAFLLTWANILDPLLFVYDERWYTLPLGMTSLAALPATDQGLVLAAAVLATIPVLLVAFVVQRFVADRTR